MDIKSSETINLYGTSRVAGSEEVRRTEDALTDS